MKGSRDLLENFGKPEDQKPFERREAPLVFMFQPETFEVVTGERLRMWEKVMIEKVGMRPDMSQFASGTISCCPDCDDCDA